MASNTDLYPDSLFQDLTPVTTEATAEAGGASSNQLATLESLPRQGEWKQLFRLLQQAQTGTPRSALILGEAGLGKTWLLEQLANSGSSELSSAILWLDFDEVSDVSTWESLWNQQLLNWSRTTLDNVLLDLKTLNLPFPIEPGAWQWTPEELQVQLRKLAASPEVPPEAVLGPHLEALWKPFYSRWRRMTFSLQDITQQVANLMGHPRVRFAYQIQAGDVLNWPCETALLAWVKALRQSGQAGALLIDHWDALLRIKPGERQRVMAALQPLLDATEAHKQEFPLLLVLACRSEAASRTLGNRLFSQFKQRHLLDPLSDTSLTSILQHWGQTGEALALQPDLEHALIEGAQGNLSLMRWLWERLQQQGQQTGVARLNKALLTTYEPVSERSVWAVEWGRLTLAYAEHSDELHQALGGLLRQTRGRPFTTELVYDLWKRSPRWTAVQAQNCLQRLQRLGWLEARAEQNNNLRWHWTSRLVVERLWERFQQDDTLPLDEVNLQTLVMQRVLPMAIRSGEFSETQLQTLLQLAQSVEEANAMKAELEGQLLEQLGHPEVRVRLTVLNGLVTLKTPALAQALNKALQDENEVVREYAARHCLTQAGWLHEAQQAEALASCLHGLKKDVSPSVQLWAYRAWFALQSTLVMPAFNKALKHPMAGVQACALEYLARFAPALREGSLRLPGEAANWMETVRERLEATESPVVRRSAFACLMQADALSPEQWLELAVSDPNPKAQEALMSAACQLAPPAVGTRLARLLVQSPKAFTEPGQVALIKGLAQWPQRESETLLLELLTARNNSLPWTNPVLWMLFRSLAKAGYTADTQQVLAGLISHPRIQNLPLLSQALKSALLKVDKRVSTTRLGSTAAPQLNTTASDAVPLPRDTQNEEAETPDESEAPSTHTALA